MTVLDNSPLQLKLVEGKVPSWATAAFPTSPSITCLVATVTVTEEFTSQSCFEHQEPVGYIQYLTRGNTRFFLSL